MCAGVTEASVESFPWWLWLPTIGPILNDVIGIGITRIAYGSAIPGTDIIDIWYRYQYH